MAYGYDPNDTRRKPDPYAPPTERPQFSSGGLTQGNTAQGAGEAAASGGETQNSNTQSAGLLSALASMRGGGGGSSGGGGGGGVLSGIVGLLDKVLGGGGTGGGGGGNGYAGNSSFSDPYGYNMYDEPIGPNQPGYYGHDPNYGNTGYETYGWD